MADYPPPANRELRAGQRPSPRAAKAQAAGLQLSSGGAAHEPRNASRPQGTGLRAACQPVSPESLQFWMFRSHQPGVYAARSASALDTAKATLADRDRPARLQERSCKASRLPAQSEGHPGVALDAVLRLAHPRAGHESDHGAGGAVDPRAALRGAGGDQAEQARGDTDPDWPEREALWKTATIRARARSR